MFSLFGKKSIRQRVAEVMAQRIEEAESEHFDACAAIDAEAEAKKEAKASALVAQVLGR